MKFIHRMLALHACNTKVGPEIATQCPNPANGIGLTEDVFESLAIVAFDAHGKAAPGGRR